MNKRISRSALLALSLCLSASQAYAYSSGCNRSIHNRFELIDSVHELHSICTVGGRGFDGADEPDPVDPRAVKVHCLVYNYFTGKNLCESARVDVVTRLIDPVANRKGKAEACPIESFQYVTDCPELEQIAELNDAAVAN